jgi:fatty-acyl-CoA synthase
MPSELEYNLLRRQNLGDSLRRSAQAAGGKPAIVFYTAAGECRELGFAALDRAANVVANSLLRRGVGKGDKVAALSRNGIEFLVLAYAAHRIGAWFVPVNFMLQPADVRHLIEFAEAKWFFVEDALLGNVRPVLDRMAGVQQFVQFGSGERLPGWMAFDELLDGPADEPQVIIESDDVATMLFTSGTESAPKGVLTTHANYHAAHLSWMLNAGFDRSELFLLSIPLIHTAGFLLATLCLTNQMTIVMTQTPQPVQMIDLIERHRVTSTALPPTLYVAMIACPNFRTRRLDSMRKLLSWASTIPKAMVDGWMEAAPQARLHSVQGMTESTAAAYTTGSVRSWAEIPNGDGRWVGTLTSFGADVRLVDDDDRDVPPGVAGEQIVRGPVVMKGYYKNDEANARTMRGGWFRTGDVLFRDEAGNYFFADRKKDMIKTGGENVYCQEVESVLGTHPAVMQCAVFGLPDERWGESVTAAVIVRAGAAVDEAELIEHCRAQLAGFKTPKRVFFRTSMPISAANKLLKRELKAEYAKGV